MSRHDLAALVKNISTKLAQGEPAAAGLLLDIAPQHPLFAPLRGLHALMLGQPEQALAFYEQAGAAGLNLPDLPYQQAQALLALQRSQDVLALLASDSNTTALQLKEAACAQQKDFAAAANFGAQLLAKGVRTTSVVTNYLTSCAKICDWGPTLDDFKDEELSPGVLVFYDDNPARLNRVAQLTASHYPKMAARPTRAPRVTAGAAARRLKIGYLSDDFRHHATTYLMAELFALHDRTHFQTYAFSYGPNDGSSVRARLQNTAEHFIDLAGQPALTVHHALHDAQLDILVDLKGHAHNTLLPWLATRPAPLQVHWLGFPGPIAAPFIDYNITDSVVVPTHIDFADKVLHLPDCSYQLNDRARQAAPALARHAYGLPEQAVVLGSFNHTGKIRPAWFKLMLKLLRAYPQCVLWQFADVPAAEQNLRACAAQHDVPQSQLVFTGAMPNPQHLARMAVADIMPDTAPCGGHTTTSEALWMGLPVVTLCGQSFATRVSASLLQHVGLPDLITENLDAYEHKLRTLIEQPALRQDYRTYLLNARATAPLFNSARWVKTFEQCLLQAYDTVIAA